MFFTVANLLVLQKLNILCFSVQAFLSLSPFSFCCYSVPKIHHFFFFFFNSPISVSNIFPLRAPGSTNSTSSSLPPPAPSLAPALNLEPSAHSWVMAGGDGGRLSSDEGDVETPEDTDRPAFHCSNHHPQPLGVNIITAYAALTEIS